LFLIIVNVLGHPKGVGGLTSNFLCGGGMDVFWNDPLAGIVFLLIQYLKRLSSSFCSCACFVIFLFQAIGNLIKIPICGPPINVQLGSSLRIQNISRKRN
jgi:hypothetical protein